MAHRKKGAVAKEKKNVLETNSCEDVSQPYFDKTGLSFDQICASSVLKVCWLLYIRYIAGQVAAASKISAGRS